jgi:hypothetical protein
MHCIRLAACCGRGVSPLLRGETPLPQQAAKRMQCIYEFAPDSSFSLDRPVLPEL